jgi:hypothetical protein
MSQALLIEVADALVAELNAEAAKPAGGVLGVQFVAGRHYRPQFDLADLKALRVSVVPKGITIASLGRASNQHDVAVDVAVQKKVDPADTAELDGLMLLVESLADFFRLRRLSTLPAAAWIKTENAPVYAPEHLEQHRVFTSVLTLTYRVVR